MSRIRCQLEKKEKKTYLPLLRLHVRVYNATRRNLLQNIYLTGFIISGLRAVRSFPFTCP